MTIKIFSSTCSLIKKEEVKAQDIVDAINTLKPLTKLEVDVPFPGKGSDFFLEWAKCELDEAKEIKDESERYRKYYNASVYSKCAVECLIDWLLSKYLLQNTISPMAGIAQKLEALDSENLLGISFTLFNDVVFEPRNRGVHRFELVEEKEARSGYDLANLTVKNCVNTVIPSVAPLYYGDIEFYEGSEPMKTMGDSEVFRFSGIGEKGAVGVLVDRESSGGNISVITSLGNGELESRYCKIRRNFTSEQIRQIFTQLERDKPKVISFKNKSNMQHIFKLLMSE